MHNAFSKDCLTGLQALLPEPEQVCTQDNLGHLSKFRKFLRKFTVSIHTQYAILKVMENVSTLEFRFQKKYFMRFSLKKGKKAALFKSTSYKEPPKLKYI